MIGLFAFAGLQLARGRVFHYLSALFARRGPKGRDLLFSLSYSTRESVHELMLLSWMLRVWEALSIAALSAPVLEGTYVLGGLGFALLFALLRLSAKMRAHHLRLIREMSSFVFRYEMALLGGSNQYHALREASQGLSLFEAQEDVDGYIEELGRLFTASKWMAIKKVIILLERGKHFTGESLSMEFEQVSSELFERYSRSQRLELEKRENLILLPMSANMLIMMVYVVVPFLTEYLWR